MKQIIFAAVNKPELIDTPIIEPRDNEVLVKTAFSTISCGTERCGDFDGGFFVEIINIRNDFADFFSGGACGKNRGGAGKN